MLSALAWNYRPRSVPGIHRETMIKLEVVQQNTSPTQPSTHADSPVPCVISFNFFGDLRNYTFLERLGPTEPEK